MGGAGRGLTGVAHRGQVGLKPEDEREIERQFWASIEEARLRR